MDYMTQIKKSNRKSIGFEIKEPGVLLVRAPHFLSQAEILQEVRKHDDWIQKHMRIVEEREQEKPVLAHFSYEDIQHMAEQALNIIPERVKYYAKMIDVTYGRITIRNQRTRWGSCSSKGNLNFNCLLMAAPEPVMDYVIIHELCHRREMNHSAHFWTLVEQVMPDYREHRQWLKEHGNELIQRMM